MCDRKQALHPILTKFGQWDDIVISQLQAIFQLFSSYPPLRRFLASQLIRYATDENGVESRGMFILSNFGQNWDRISLRLKSEHLQG